MGYHLSDDELKKVFVKFKSLADKKKDIMDADIEALVNEDILRGSEHYSLEYLHVGCGTTVTPMAHVKMKIAGETVSGFSDGNGPIDAAFNAITKVSGEKPELLRFTVSALTGGTDAQGEVTVRVKDGESIALGKGADPDIITASAKAYINGLNRLSYIKINPVNKESI